MTETDIYCPNCGHHLFKADLHEVLEPASPGVEGEMPAGTVAALSVLKEFFGSQRRLVRVEHGRVSQRAAMGVLREWLHANGVEMSDAAVGRGLRAVGIESRKSNGERFYGGLALTNAPD